MNEDEKACIKLTATIARDDMDFIDELVAGKKYANRTDVARDAIRHFRQALEGSGVA